MTDLAEFLAKARVSNVIPVVEKMPADIHTPLGAYIRLSNKSENSFLLESVEGGENLARYSFIGADPFEVCRGTASTTTVTKGESSARVPIGILEYLQRHFADRKAVVDPDLPSFCGGAIGYLGYECAEWFEPTLKRDEAQSGIAAFMMFRSIVAFDHATQAIKIITLVFTDEGADADRLQVLYEAAAKTNAKIRSTLNGPLPTVDPGSIISNGKFTSNWARSDFEAAVLRIKELILAGECYQAVLSQCFSKPTNVSALSLYRALRSLNPSPYMFLLQFGDKAVVGASPEMLVRCERGRLEYRPIAGTRPRGKRPEEDRSLAEEMRHDPKEVAEHVMLVDLGRNDLGRVAQYGSVKVDRLMDVEKYSHVQHLVSSLSADLRPDLDRFSALAACFPAGTVSGAPKVRAMEIIRDLEPTKRGIYAGAIGHFDYLGNMDTCIAIRTLVLEKGVASVQAGAGIVADSAPESEFEETVNKAKSLIKAVEIAESGIFETYG